MGIALLELLLVVMAVLVLLFLATQVVAPLFTGEPMFSLFRKSAVKAEIIKAEHTLESVAEVAHLKDIADEIQRQTAKLKEPK